MVGERYTDLARTCIDTLIEHGTDRYGIVHSPVWVTALDVDTLDCPRWFDDCVERIRYWRLAQGERMYSTYVPYGFGHRAIRASQRPAGCTNLFLDQPTIRAVALLDALEGAERAQSGVAEYVQYYTAHFVDPQTGLWEWGVHTSWDVHQECVNAKDGHWHEVQVILPHWPRLHEIAPERTERLLELFFEWHTDPQSGEVGRHPERGKGCNFAMAAGEVVLACAYMHTLRPDDGWLDRALLVARSHWSHRNTETDLFPNQFPTERLRERFDSQASDTSVPGLWASRVLMAGRLTDCDELTEMARRVLVAWARHGWEEEAGAPWAMLLPDGTPVRGEREQSQQYDKFAPKGHWNWWEDYVYGFEYPFKAMVSFAMAAEWTGDEELLDHARRLADCYVQRLPANEGMGTFAANYGQLISFLLYLSRLSDDARLHDAALSVADEAVGHLWTGRIFRGFPAKRHYEAVDGVGYLLQALIELEADPERLASMHASDPFAWNL